MKTCMAKIVSLIAVFAVLLFPASGCSSAQLSKEAAITKITVVSETKQLDTLWESPKENSEDS